MSTTSSINKQALNKGKRKVVEDLEAILNRSKEMVLDEGLTLEDQDKGKEISMVKDPNANRDKGKAILVEEPDASKDSKYLKIFGFIVEPCKGKRKVGYSCDFCDKTFLTPQALGGHQNGHKWERNLKQKIQYINIAVARSSYYKYLSSSTLPSYKPFNGNQGASLNPMTMTGHLPQHYSPAPYAKTRYGYQYDGLDETFHHAGTKYGALENGNNNAFPNPQKASAGFETGAFQHPERAWFSPSFGTQEISKTSSFQHPLSACFNSGSRTNSSTPNIGHGAFDPLELEWLNFNPGFGTKNNGRVDNIFGLHQERNKAKETQQGGKSGFDFVLFPRRNGENTKAQQDEASKIDLILKL